ncbi:MAG: hypothetical protein L0K27_04790 [Corynebacterium nuruki]|nr:hypothetical protein [Corynebacterium nuruki]
MNTVTADRLPATATAVTVTTVPGILELAESLCTGAAGVPTLVVTAVNRTREVHLDLSRITDEFPDAVRLVVMENPDLTRAFTGAMPPDATPYNGAARIYPAHDLDWMDDPFADDLLFAGITDANGDRVTGVVIDRLRVILAAAAASADLQSPAPGADRTAVRPFRGEFSGALSPRSAMVTSPDAPGAFGVLQLDLDALQVSPTVTVDGLFRAGDEVCGTLGADGTVASLDGLREPAAMVAELVVGGCYPAVVTGKAGKSQVGVQVIPGTGSTLTQQGIDRTAAAGDVVTVQVQSVSKREGQVRIAVGPVVDGPVPLQDAPALRDGGPAWLPRPTGSAGSADAGPAAATATSSPAASAAASASASTSSGPDSELTVLRGRVPALRAQIHDLSAEIDRLRDALSTVNDENGFAWDEHDRLEQENALLRDRLTAAGLGLPGGVAGVPAGAATAGAAGASGHRPRSSRKLRVDRQTVYTECVLKGTEFTAPDDQLAEEIRLSWARNVDAPAKAGHPLNYRFGDGFLASVAKTVRADESARRKLPEVLAWIAAGYEERTARHHAYRAGTGGGAPQVIRYADGAKAFRVDLETSTAAARRLHYWKLPDGSVEFHSVNLHDDYPSM